MQHDEYAKANAGLLLEKSEKETAHQELRNEKAKYKDTYEEFAGKFSDAKKVLRAVMKLAIYLNNKGRAASLDELKRAVFESRTPWDAIGEIFDTL